MTGLEYDPDTDPYTVAYLDGLDDDDEQGDRDDRDDDWWEERHG